MNYTSENSAEILNRHRKYIVRFARLKKLRPDEINDLLQDVYLRVHDRIAQFQGTDDRSLRNWVMQITKNMIFDKYRRSKFWGETNLDLVVARPTDTEKRILAQGVLALLEPMERNLFVQLYIKGYTYEEMLRLNSNKMSIAAIRARMSRAKRALREKLGIK